jgi:hypothetical protein
LRLALILPMPKILLSFNPAARKLYYGDKALAGLRALGSVRLHEHDQALAWRHLDRCRCGL